MSPCPVCGKEHAEDTSCANQPSASRVGQVVGGKYRVTRLIGEGGMASVYEARHVTIDRPFALKFLHPWLSADEEWLERFRREGIAGGSLMSEHIAAILDTGVTADGAPYILMELLLGEDLGQRLAREGFLKPPEAIEIITQACHSLAVAHQAGVIHRDLKPENVFLCERELGGILVKVLDFGIAKLRNSATHATRAGMVMGTPYYMSPEQARGRGDVDHRTDVYALGVMLYELLSGDKPFTAEDHGAVLNQIVASDTPDVRQLCPSLSAELCAVVHRAIAKDVEQRFQSAEELADALLPFWPQTRRSSHTARSFGSRASVAPASLSPHLTSREPRVTVRVTGSKNGVRSPLAVAVAEPAAAADASGSPKLGTGSASSTEFGDLTEPNAQAALSATAERAPNATAADPAPQSASLRGAPAKPQRTPRARETAETIAAPSEPTSERPEQVVSATSPEEDATPVATSIQTVGLGKTLLPLAAGIIAIVVVVSSMVSTTQGVSDELGVADESQGASVEVVETREAAEVPAASDSASDVGGSSGASVPASTADEAEARGAAAHEAVAVPSEQSAVPQGLLDVLSDLPAQLSIDGLAFGRTPKRQIRLPAGVHKIELVHPEFGRRLEYATVHAEKPTVLRVKLRSGRLAPTATSAATAAAPSATAATENSSKAACSPNWFLDGNGVRRVKPGCLRTRPSE